MKVVMAHLRRPYIYCHTCGADMNAPQGSIEEMAVSSAEEVREACKEQTDFPKVLRCTNTACFAPQRAVIIPHNLEAKLVAEVRSWSPVTTFRLSYQDAKDYRDRTFAVAEFAVDSIRRLPDISFGDSIDVDLLRRTLDGFGREIKGAFTVFDLFCWGDMSDPSNWLLHPIEAFDPSVKAAPPRFNPFCSWVRQRIHSLVLAELQRRFRTAACPFDVRGVCPILPAAPEFGEFLAAVPETDRKGRVFKLVGLTVRRAQGGGARGKDRVTASDWVSKVVCRVGKAARVKVDTKVKRSLKTGELTTVVKYASAHDLRRSFGERWAPRVMPQVLKELMRHEDITTTLRFYVGRNAQATADILWNAYERKMDEKGSISGSNGQSEGQAQEKSPS